MKLIEYGSGDGALHFTWCTRMKGDWIASGQNVTKGDVGRFLRTKEGRRLRNKGFRRYYINGLWVLARFVERVGENALQMGDDVFEYMKDIDNKWGFWVYYDHPKRGRIEVHNMSILGNLRFFIKNEECILEQDAVRNPEKPWL